MKNINVLKSTTNRSEFNRAYKMYLERNGKIRCTYCKYHENENRTNKYYGGYKLNKGVRYPNWKLVSKNSKQWMKKRLVIGIDTINTYRGLEYTKISF